MNKGPSRALFLWRNMDYEIKQVITSEERASIVKKLAKIKPVYYHQNYNLHDVKQWSGSINGNTFPEIKGIHDLFPELDVYSSYFLEYGVDSFTKQHTDDDKQIAKTIVTLIQSTNLKGGETIVLKTYKNKPRPSWAKRKGDAWYNKKIIPEVVYMEDGESIIYDHALPHSVSQVTQGTRLVLVTWLTNRDK